MRGPGVAPWLFAMAFVGKIAEKLYVAGDYWWSYAMWAIVALMTVVVIGYAINWLWPELTKDDK